MSLQQRIQDWLLSPALQPWLARARKYAPWASLLFGVLGALLMDRTPKNAWLVGLAAAGGWLSLLGFELAGRIDPALFSGRGAWLSRAAKLSALLGAQSLVQTCLLFALPWYAKAAVPSVSHAVFLLVLTAATAASLWDPLYEAIVRRTAASFALQALASFAALNVVFPMLGLSNRASLAFAALATALAAPLQAWLTAAPERRRRNTVLAATAVLVAFPALFLVGATRLVPPAPLALVDGAIGTELEDRTVTHPRALIEGRPEQLVCATAVSAPLGLRDALVHVWKKDRELRDEIQVQVRGGREEGFRTWSEKRNLGADWAGTWSCTVETASGQLLGERHVVVR